MDTSNRPQNRAKKRPTHRASYSKGLNKEFEQRLRRLENVVDLSEMPDQAPQFLTKFQATFLNKGECNA